MICISSRFFCCREENCFFCWELHCPEFLEFKATFPFRSTPRTSAWSPWPRCRAAPPARASPRSGPARTTASTSGRAAWHTTLSWGKAGTSTSVRKKFIFFFLERLSCDLTFPWKLASFYYSCIFLLRLLPPHLSISVCVTFSQSSIKRREKGREKVKTFSETQTRWSNCNKMISMKIVHLFSLVEHRR